MGSIKFIGSLVMITAFTIAILSYSTMFATDNSAVLSISNDSNAVALKSDLESKTQTFKTETNETTSKAFFETGSTSFENAETLANTKKTGSAVFGSMKTIATFISLRLFGNDVRFGVITTLFLSFLTIVSVLYAIKLIKGGNPD